MKKFFISICAAVIIAASPLAAIDLGNGFSLGGGVKTGFLMRSTKYSGTLADATKERPLAIYYASEENETYGGEGWLDFDYSGEFWGLHLGLWAHGDMEAFDGNLGLGDRYLWADFFSHRLQLKGGQGGGTPISTGGWLNADWLGYPGIRLFWVDPLGFSIGLNFTDPGPGGLSPEDYITTIMLGAQFRNDHFWVTFVADNNPIFDNTDADHYGGLHYVTDPDRIGESANIAFGAGVNNLYGGRGVLAFDGMVSNINVDPRWSNSPNRYEIYPLSTTLSIKTGSPIVLSELYGEVKAKYNFKQGENSDNTATATWGKLEIEPYISYQVLEKLKLEFAINMTYYINSYYLAYEKTFNTAIGKLPEGQIPAYREAGPYASIYQVFVKPALIFNYGGGTIVFGYKGTYSADHRENTVYLDLRWTF
jgi:hypothetical protein